MPTVSVVIPVYHAEQTLMELYSQLVATLEKMAPSFEILFVEDAGGDCSWSIIVSILLVALANALIRGSVVAGFAFLASTTAICSGAQLFALGIIGEYLARVHFRSMDRPAYVVRDVT